MSVDLTKLILHTGYDTFKNNKIYTGSFTVSGSTSAGVNIKTYTVTLDTAPSYYDVVFNGPTDAGGTDPRTSSAWFEQGYVWVPGNNTGAGYTDYQTAWRVYSPINGTTLTITLIFSQQFSSSLTLTNTSFSYRLVDYSVTG